ncbi:twin-arginine translocase TatA/TatE family subunit [Lentisphaerae bacterium WC36]|nr:twin-arginine translocase TatA/TatE family subunit [Lentisphaerae bacterium WC36]
MPGNQELIVIVLIILIFFGAKKIPELARGIGKGIREFKKGLHDVHTEITAEDDEKSKSNTKVADKYDRTPDQDTDKKA